MISLVDGALNFRDVGGLRANGGMTRSGVLYRSGNLAQVTPRGERELAALGLVSIVDLRDDDELVWAPTRATSAAVTRVPVLLGSVASFFENDMSLDEMYRSIVDDSAEQLVTALRVVLAAQPTLVHCTVGKDRTGIVVALALAAAGVDDDAVIENYAQTERLLPEERNVSVRRFLAGMYPDIRHLDDLTCRSPARVMRRLLDDLTVRFGSPADYLRASGMTDAELAALRDVLVTDAHRSL